MAVAFRVNGSALKDECSDLGVLVGERCKVPCKRGILHPKCLSSFQSCFQGTKLLNP